MKDWNFDISQAPLSHFKEQKRTDKKGKSSVSKIFIEKVIITASKCGKVIRSYWLPKEKRWAGYTPEGPPIAWQLYPKHPHKASPHTERDIE